MSDEIRPSGLTVVPEGEAGAAASSDLRYYSFSQLSTYRGCGKKYELSYVHQLPRTPQGSLLLGSTVHETIAQAEANEWWNHDATPETIKAQDYYIEKDFTERFVEKVAEAGGPGAIHWAKLPRETKEFPGGLKDFDWCMKKGPSMGKRFCTVRRDDRKLGLVPHESGSVETHVRATLPSGEGVQGYIDALLMISADGEPIVRDYKTGTWRDDSQLWIYAWLLRESRDLTPTRGQMVMLGQETNMVKEFPIDNTMIDLVPGMFAGLSFGIEHGIFPTNPSSFCGSCTMRPHCPVGNTAWARQLWPDE